MTIQEILDEYNIPYLVQGEHHHATEGFFQVDCPFCSPDTNGWRLGLSRSGLAANCWNCGQKSVFDALQELTGLPANEVYKLKSGIEFQQTKHKVKAIGKLQLPKGLGAMQKCHRKYLRSRGFDPDKLEKLWGIQGIGLAAKYSWRLFIPVFYRGAMVSWTTRSISDECETRYVNAPPECETISLKDCIFGEDYLRHSIAIFEGPTDVFNVGPGSSCTFGVNVTSSQLNKIISYPTRIVCFDSEKQAQKRARYLCDQIESFPGKTINVVNEYKGKDPGSWTEDSVQDFRKRFLDD